MSDKMGKIKVLILCYLDLNGPNNTGSKIYDDRLIHHLSKNEDIDLNILTIGDKNSIITTDNLTYTIIKKKSILPNFIFLPILMCNIRKKIIEINPDIINTLSTTLFYAIVTTTLIKKFPTILTAYGILAKERELCFNEYSFYQKMLSIVRVINERYLLSKIRNIIVDTSSVRDLVRSWTKSKIYIVPAGIEYEKIINFNLKFDKLEIDIFFINNLINLKGADILINSIGLVRNFFPKIKVYIAGTGPQKNELKKLTEKLNLDSNIKFLGHISDEDKYRYYKSSKIVVVPSRWDCQPAALFDAAALSKPVIASDASNPEIIIDQVTGLVFKSGDIVDLSNKIIYLLKNKRKRDEMGINAKHHINKYDWDNVSREYVNIYKNAISDFNESD